MCTSTIEQADIAASGKAGGEWLPLTKAFVYYDHPLSMTLDHALIIDFARDGNRAGRERIAVEMSAASARELVRAIESALATDTARQDLSRQAVPV